jgi:cysteine synthase A
MNDAIVSSVLDVIGHTPLVRLGRIVAKGGAAVVGKLESKNPGGSVKDRPALAMIEAAEHAGSLRAGSVVVEATSGKPASRWR